MSFLGGQLFEEPPFSRCGCGGIPLNRWLGVKRQVGLGSAAVGEVQPGSEVEGFFQEPESSRDVDGLSVSRPVALLASA